MWRFAGPGGECEECKLKRTLGLQTKLSANAPGDEFEQEADRVAQAVVSGGSVPRAHAGASSTLQRQEALTGFPPGKEPSQEEKYQQAGKKIGEAFLETKTGKELKAQAVKLGKEFVSTVEGKVIVGTALGGALAAIIATNSELPVPIPEIPLDFISPGLKGRITYEGPVQKPTNVGLVLTTATGVGFGASYGRTEASGGKPEEQKAGLTFSIPLGPSPKSKPGASEGDKFRAETARMAAEQAKFREGLKTPEQRAGEDEAFQLAFWQMQSRNPLAVPRLQMPPSLGGTPEKKPEEASVQRKAADGATTAATAPRIVHEVLQSPGQPLDAATRAFMEPRFGHDFSRVRVHTGAPASESARAVHAHAYTAGGDIVFDQGAYSPSTENGRQLLAHELTHVVQQEQHSSASVQRQAAPAPGPAAAPAGGGLSPEMLEQIARQASGSDVWIGYGRRSHLRRVGRPNERSGRRHHRQVQCSIQPGPVPRPPG